MVFVVGLEKSFVLQCCLEYPIYLNEIKTRFFLKENLKPEVTNSWFSMRKSTLLQVVGTEKSSLWNL